MTHYSHTAPSTLQTLSPMHMHKQALRDSEILIPKDPRVAGSLGGTGLGEVVRDPGTLPTMEL